MRSEVFNARYHALVNREKLAATTIDVIGCGTIGRPLTLILAAMGADRLTLWDDDTIDAENLGNQGWPHTAAGRELGKVTLLGDTCNREYDCHPVERMERVNRDTRLTGDVRFYCVDSIEARQAICAVPGGKLHIDGRIGGEKLQVVCQTDRLKLMETIPTENGEAPCGRQSTLYIGYVCAGLMVSQFIRWLRGEPAADVYQNLATGAGRWGFIQ